MDESWRMRMGMPSPAPRPKLPTYPARRSTEDAASHRRNHIPNDPLDPEDFTDVFGGPPHTVLSRQFSTGLPRSSSTYFYEEIFQPAEIKPASTVVRRSGRSLPEFRIPGQSRKGTNQRNRVSNVHGFYGDIFGREDGTPFWNRQYNNAVRSRSRSKTSSSSVLSSEELSPLRPAISGDDNDDVCMFASKLRPINVRWNSTGTVKEDYQRKQKSPLFAAGCNQPHNYSTENGCSFENTRNNYAFCESSRRNASPETISLEPISNRSYIGVSAEDDVDAADSPSSAVSSVGQSDDQEIKAAGIEEEILRQGDAMEEDEDEDEEVMSSYVIEINSDHREGMSESNGVDEAIAWAKEKFQTHCSDESKAKSPQEILNVHPHQLSEGQTESFGSLDEQQDKWTAEEDADQFEIKAQREMQILDEKIRLWSTGKENDIRLLLTSLHHILHPKSGWSSVPLTNIIESSQVKKAYQKARLCLHPDKLQQRGASLPEKYIAERAFSLLQDAWATFTSGDVPCR